MPRRGENIRKRNDGRWEGRYSVYDFDRCARVVKSVYARSYSEVRIKLLNAKNTAGIAKSGNGRKKFLKGISFTSTASEWLESVRENKKWSTYIKYKRIYEKYILSYMGDMNVQNIADGSVNTEFRQVYADLTKRLSSGVLRTIVCVFNKILAHAAQRYGIAFTKEKTEYGQKACRPVEVFTKKEQASLINSIYSCMDTSSLGIYLCLCTGMRLGEICALRWEDIDMERKTIKIRRTVQRIAVEDGKTKTALMITTPKSFFSVREIPVPDELFRLLNKVALKHGRQGYILNGDKPLEPRTYEYRFARLLKKAGVGNRKFHVLRHTFATNCIVNGVDAKALSELLGHSDVKITLNRYVHPTLDVKRDYINLLADIYGRYRGQENCEMLLEA